MSGNPIQSREALKVANRIRLEGSALKRAVKSGAITLSQALDMPEAGSLRLGALILAQNKVGRMRQMSLLKQINISESRRVDALTEHERKRIREALND